MKDFLLCFVPLFIAVDAVGVLPIFINLTEGVESRRLNVVVLQSLLTATLVAVLFIFVGLAVFNFLGITVADFMVAGGILLLFISLSDLLSGEKTQRKLDLETLGAVPIGVPLITGPAVLTTAVLLMQQHGAVKTVAAVVVNILIAGVVFWFARPITRFLGNAGVKTLSKIASLLLASIAVMLIRKGIFSFVHPGMG